MNVPQLDCSSLCVIKEWWYMDQKLRLEASLGASLRCESMEDKRNISDMYVTYWNDVCECDDLPYYSRELFRLSMGGLNPYPQNKLISRNENKDEL